MKSWFIAAVALVVSSHVVLADLIIVQKLESPMQSGEMTVKVKGDKIRTDMAGQMSAIMDGATGDMTSILHAQKIYMKMSAATMRNMAEQMRKTTAEQKKGAEPKLVPNGQKQTINGFETEGYTFDNGQMKIVYWICKNHPLLKQLMAATEAMQKSQADATAGLMPKAADFPGVPIKTEVDTAGQKITTTLISAKEEAVSDSEFTLPADYQEMKMPAMPGGSEGQ